MTDTRVARKYYAILDVMKLCMAFMIVCIHTTLLPSIFVPTLRMAVPLFFIISSYLFFSKVYEVKGVEDKRNILHGYIKRTITLLLTWTIILAPITYNDLYTGPKDMMSFALFLTHGFFLGSTFGASWFLSACLIGIPVVYLFIEHSRTRTLVIISLILYVFATISSSYINLFDGTAYYNLVKGLLIDKGILLPYRSIVVSMIWLTIGALLANKRFEKISSTNLFVATIVGYLLQNAECGASRYLSWGVSSESTFALLLVCPSLFLLTKRIKINIRNGAFIRLYSTILYCTHYSMIYIFITFLCTGKLSTTIIVSIVALFASLFIYKFESRVKALKWLH